MSRRRRVPFWICAGFLSSAAFQACSSSSAPDGNGNGAGVSGAGGSTQTDGQVVDAPPGAGAGGESPFDSLCGVTDDGCVPDNVTGDRSCSPGSAGAAAGNAGTSGGSAGTGGRAGSGGASGGAGSGGAGSGGAGSGSGGSAGLGGAPGGGASNTAGSGGEISSGEGGMSGGAGEAGAAGDTDTTSEGGGAGISSEAAGESGGGQSSASGGEGGVSGESGATAGVGGGGISGSGSVQVPRSCQVELRNGDPRAVCAPSGQGTTSAACFSSADCAPGLACVGDTSPGQCRPYCCAGDASCSDAGTHCTERKLVGTDGRPSVPVCMPATGCSLAEEYPCAPGATCTCPMASACMVVTSDGKTSCVPAVSLPPEGKGEAGQSCPCAWGHVCSAATERCVRLCQTAAPGNTCAGARCQFAAGLPPGWGVCLTSGADAG